MKNPNGTVLKDGHWYSIIRRSPRLHEYGKWVADNQWFIWQGTSETKLLEAGAVDELLCEVDPDGIDPGISNGLR